MWSCYPASRPLLWFPHRPVCFQVSQPPVLLLCQQECRPVCLPLHRLVCWQVSRLLPPQAWKLQCRKVSWPPHLVVSASVSTSVLQTNCTVRQCLGLPIAHCVANSLVSTSNSLSASALTCASASSLPSVSSSVENYLGIQSCHQMSRNAPRRGVPACQPLLQP